MMKKNKAAPQSDTAHNNAQSADSNRNHTELSRISKQPSRPASVLETGALLLAQSPEGVTVWSLWARTGRTSARNVPSDLKRVYGIDLGYEGEGNAKNDGLHKRHWIKNKAGCLKVLGVVNSKRKKRNAILLTQAEIDQIAASYPAA